MRGSPQRDVAAHKKSFGFHPDVIFGCDIRLVWWKGMPLEEGWRDFSVSGNGDGPFGAQEF